MRNGIVDDDDMADALLKQLEINGDYEAATKRLDEDAAREHRRIIHTQELEIISLQRLAEVLQR